MRPEESEMTKLCSKHANTYESKSTSARAAQKIVARLKTGKPSTDALAKLIAEEFEELNPEPRIV